MGFKRKWVGKVVEKGRAVVLKAVECLRQVEETRNWIISLGTHFVERDRERETKVRVGFQQTHSTPHLRFLYNGDSTRIKLTQHHAKGS